MELIRYGVESPRNVRLHDGSVIRVLCKRLPDGGRMLVYSDVTDLVTQADRLKQLATTDGLTSLFNRRHLIALLEAELVRYQRYLRPVSLLMLDVDKFKSINDRFGHDVGDAVLMEVAGIILAHTRECDITARFGGEEFAIVLPETSEDHACVLAERIRSDIQSRAFCSNRHIKTTISIGVAQAKATCTSVFQLIKEADRALYAAKRLGRNKICCSSALDPSTDHYQKAG
jgi:diguanylate cyclase (GGDEF)-like protein